MNALLRFLELAALAAHAHGERFGEDRERSLRLRVRADVEPAGAVDALDRRLVDTGLQQPLPASLLVAARAEGADVERVRPDAAFSAGTSNLSSCVSTTTAVA